MILFPNQKGHLFFPAVMNAVLCFISIPTGIVFYFSADNHFGRGTLGYLPYFVNALYLFYLIFSLFRYSRAQKDDFRLMLYISLTSVMCLVFPLLSNDSTSHWFNMTIAVDVMLYYVFLLQQFTKRDSLTNLLNRQSYYSDAERYSDDITAVVAMDMNGLKEINDNEGHKAGDTALQALADCFWKAASHGQRVYRIGGDEYLILCIDTPEKDVLSLTERIHQEVAKTPYTCSVGYAMKTDDSTIDKG
jgi:diguanylate cyclase (GGDEF)-like protein